MSVVMSEMVIAAVRPLFVFVLVLVDFAVGLLVLQLIVEVAAVKVPIGLFILRLIAWGTGTIVVGVLTIEVSFVSVFTIDVSFVGVFTVEVSFISAVVSGIVGLFIFEAFFEVLAIGLFVLWLAVWGTGALVVEVSFVGAAISGIVFPDVDAFGIVVISVVSVGVFSLGCEPSPKRLLFRRMGPLQVARALAIR